MTWFKVDDALHSHPKAREAGLEAMGLWVLAGSYAGQYLTDGHVPTWFVSTFPNGTVLADRLVEAGLWDVTPFVPRSVPRSVPSDDGADVPRDSGWQFHDWSEFQPSKSEVEDEREKARERKRKWREKKQAADQAEREPSPDVTPSVTRDETRDERVTRRGTNAAPTRPDPTRPSTKEPFVSEVADATPRPDVVVVLDYLDDKIRDLDAKVPTRNKSNLDAARLLIDKDGRTVDQIKAAIDFATGDEFWRGVILSMSKLRQKYDQLRLQAQRSSRPSGRRATPADGDWWQAQMDAAAAHDEALTAHPFRQIGA